MKSQQEPHIQKTGTNIKVGYPVSGMCHSSNISTREGIEEFGGGARAIGPPRQGGGGSSDPPRGGNISAQPTRTPETTPSETGTDTTIAVGGKCNDYISQEYRHKGFDPFRVLEGQGFQPVVAEKLMVRVWIEERSAKRCIAEIRERLGFDYRVEWVYKAFKKDRVINYLKECLRDKEVAGEITKEKWIREAREYEDGTKTGTKATVFWHKLVGQAMGYMQPDIQVQQNTQVNFTQADGSA